MFGHIQVIRASAMAISIACLSGCGDSGGASGTAASAVQPTLPVAVQPSLTPSPTPTPATSPVTQPATSTDPTVAPAMVASNWEIGPIISGKDYSVGMPLSPTETSDGWAFAFPLSPGSVHYVTFHNGSLAGRTHIVIHYRIDADASVNFLPVCCAQLDSTGPTLYFQQSGDDWNTDGMRWWATFAAPYRIKPGEYTIDVPLDGDWTSVNSMTAAKNPAQFQIAKQNADRVGFTFGGGDGYGHGVYTSGTAHFVLLSFTIE